jgi:hypothetical protein
MRNDLFATFLIVLSRQMLRLLLYFPTTADDRRRNLFALSVLDDLLRNRRKLV